MEEKDIRRRYYNKAMESFATRLNLFLFDRIISKKHDENNSIGPISTIDFQDFKITEGLINIYVTQYFQKKYDEEVINGWKVDNIYEKLKDWKKKPESDNLKLLRSHYWNKMFQTKEFFLYEMFHENFTNYEQKCHYCGITYEMTSSLRAKGEIFNKRDTRGFSMEIDRKEPNREYTSGNSVLCCYWCNNAKTDEFCDTEYIPIGESFRLLWNKRLAKHNLELIPDPPSPK